MAKQASQTSELDRLLRAARQDVPSPAMQRSLHSSVLSALRSGVVPPNDLADLAIRGQASSGKLGAKLLATLGVVAVIAAAIGQLRHRRIELLEPMPTSTVAASSDGSAPAGKAASAPAPASPQGVVEAEPAGETNDADAAITGNIASAPAPASPQGVVKAEPAAGTNDANDAIAGKAATAPAPTSPQGVAEAEPAAGTNDAAAATAGKIATAPAPTSPRGVAKPERATGTNSAMAAAARTAPVKALPSEASLIDQAHRQLLSHPEQALALAEMHRKLYPKGVLLQEREVIAIEALSRLGKLSAAEKRANSFRTKQPHSIHDSRLRSVLGDAGVAVHP